MNLYKEEQNLLRLERELAAKEAKDKFLRRCAEQQQYQRYCYERSHPYPPIGASERALFRAKHAEWKREKLEEAMAKPCTVRMANEAAASGRSSRRRCHKISSRGDFFVLRRSTLRRNKAGKLIGGHDRSWGKPERWQDSYHERPTPRSNERERLARLAADDCMDDMVDYDPMSELVEYLDEGAGWCYYRSYDEVGGDDFLRSGDARPYWDQCPKRLKRCEDWLTDVEESDYYATKAGCQATDLEYEIAEKQMVLDKLVKERDYYDARMKKLYGRQ